MRHQQAIQVDDAVHRRFSDNNTAFNAVSRELGEDWNERFHERRLRLVAEGKVAPGEALAHPGDALSHYGLGTGFGAIREMTLRYFARDDVADRYWSPPTRVPAEVRARRSDDAAKLTRHVRLVARRCGAALVGVTRIDPRWVYADVRRRREGAQGVVRKRVRIADAEHSTETDEALVIPARMENVVVVAVPMDREMILTAPSLLAEAATDMGYSDAARCVLSVAEYIRAIGYQAIPSLNDMALSIPLAIQAGLGELGRNGLLIAKEYGPCVRLAKVFTDMPLLMNDPVDLGIRAYCETCRECARHCRAGAISGGARTYVGHNECNNDGVLKWYVDTKKCLRYWIASGTSCSACIARCPFALGKEWWLGGPQTLIRRTPRLNGAVAWLDRRTGRRKRRESDGYLERARP